jgi:multimeric flavodoxin WrbA
LSKVLAINGSPNMEKGNTARVLNPFLEGIKEAGASVEMCYVTQFNIKPCTAEFYCWNDDPGNCYIDDDMQILYPKLRDAEILVLATPVYIPLPSEVQDLLNRLCPLLEPLLVWRGGRTRAKFHDNVNISKIVLVASSGWWELENFDTVIRIVKEIAEDASVEFVGPVLRPHSHLLSRDNEKSRQVLDALKEAGHSLIEKGCIPLDILEAISQPLISEEEYRLSQNEAYMKVKNRKMMR